MRKCNENTIPDILFIAIALILSITSCKSSVSPSVEYSGWSAYGGSKDGMRYSSNDQINANNVTQLEVAWTYSSGDRDEANGTQNQCNPIVINGILYGTTPRLKLFALDAATGKQKWIFDPAKEDASAGNDPYSFFKINRGVIYWEDENKANQRIIYSAGSKTYAINAADGTPVRSFGKGGYIDLTENIDREPGSYDPFIINTTPGVVYKDILISGSSVTEAADAAPGTIRAYSVLTGELKWKFHTIPQPGDPGYETWPDKDAWRKVGAANDWAGMSLDEKRGIVYIPTGSAGSDFYGNDRKGQNLFANCLVALEAETGKYLWHYQVVHHDLWDRDLPANPNLVTIRHDGKEIDAVAQITKQGYVFVFDRTNGVPVFPIREQAVPQSGLTGEETWPTQPIPTLPEPFARQEFGLDDINDRTPEAHLEMLEEYRKVKYYAMYTPPSEEGAWVFPGFGGGGEWGGAAVDPATGIMYVNSTEVPCILRMAEIEKGNQNSPEGTGRGVYGQYCMACHGAELKGSGSLIPSLVNIGKKYNADQLKKIIRNGRNTMPAFAQIPEDDLKALQAFLINGLPQNMNRSEGDGSAVPVSEAGKVESKGNNSGVASYSMTGYKRFYDKDGYPGIKPPWGTLNAVDLNTGKLLWKVPLGDYPELTAKGIPATGTECYGGPLVTKGGLVFIAASKDSKMHAFDKNTGKLLWEAQLPVPGYANPATYTIDGKQYVVIACGGGKLGSRSGDQYVAFALPD